MKVKCWCCGKTCAVTSKNWIHKHKIYQQTCAGSGTRPNTVIDKRV